MLFSRTFGSLGRRAATSQWSSTPKMVRCSLPSLAARTYATESGLHINPISGALGAEVSGIDLTANISPEHSRTMRKALQDHQVLFFRGQKLDPAQYKVFTSHFGKPQIWPLMRGFDDHPEVIEVLKKETDVKNYAGIWHSDSSYMEEPPAGGALLAMEVPPFGGDTLFANQILAYEALSDGLKETISKLNAVYSSEKTRATIRGTKENNLGHKKSLLEAVHPVVRTMPESGRKALFVNTAHTSHIDGWTFEESQPLLQYLYDHQIKPEFTCRFGWDVGSIALWDNRCVLHNPINDYQGYRRSLYRIILEGEKPV